MPDPLPPPSQSKSAPETTWQPGPSVGPGVRLAPPEVIEGTQPGPGTPAPKGGVQLYPPIVSDNDKPAPPKVEIKTQPKSEPKTEPKTEPKPQGGLPVGIPQFALARDQVANGLRPALDDGLDWLQANGYKTVVCLHQPGEPIAADRKQVENRGMKFVALQVSPQTLNQKVIDEFNRLVADSGQLPLFVYDRDGSLAGSLWYLHFRLTQDASDEKARRLAGPLGLRPEAEGLQREMWLAVQKYLSDNPR
jgi:protein tyrosine phosphatase (PTP) superfamily phosphohydrolase (DUF442 family)